MVRLLIATVGLLSMSTANAVPAQPRERLEQIVYRAITEICPAVLRNEIDLSDPKSAEITGLDPAPPSFMQNLDAGTKAALYTAGGEMVFISRIPGSSCAVSASAPTEASLPAKVKRALTKAFGEPVRHEGDQPPSLHYDLGKYDATWKSDNQPGISSLWVQVSEK